MYDHVISGKPNNKIKQIKEDFIERMNKEFLYHIKHHGLFHSLFGRNQGDDQPKQEKYQPRSKLSNSLLDNMLVIRQRLDSSADLNVRELEVGSIKVSILTAENMADLSSMHLSMMTLSKSFEGQVNTKPQEVYQFFEQKLLFSSELSDVYTMEELLTMIMSGFMVVLIDGMNRAVALGAQGFQFRGISEPSGEGNVRGSREGFTEPVKINMSMIRRRIKSEKLKFEGMVLGEDSITNITLVYMNGLVSEELLNGIRYRLSKIKSKMILNSGNLQPFLESSMGSLFSEVGYTERPDTLCYKINEGRVGILVDGTPFALIVPYVFSENFQSIDDADQKPYYVCLVRMLKYIAFGITILLPGFFVAMGMYHPELFPPSLLLNVVASQETTPFSMLTQALFIQFVYEIMREAGLRLPRPIGHTVGIIGSLVIGEAAVTSGLISAPMVMIVAITAISSYVIPNLQEPGTALRFLFIIVGGYAGLYGIALLSIIVLVNACAVSAFGVPYMAPIAPFNKYSMRDTFLRLGHQSMQNHRSNLSELNGVHINRD